MSYRNAICGAATLAILGLTPVAAQSQSRPNEALAGMTAVRVKIRIEIPPGVSIDTLRLGIDVRATLAQHGWSLLDGPGHEDSPLFFIGALVVESRARAGAPVYAIRYECSVTEAMRRVRDRVDLPASTWSTGQISLVVAPAQLSPTVRDGVLALVAKLNHDRGPILTRKA